MKKNVGYILSGNEMERLRRQAKRNKRELLEEQKGGGVVSKERNVLNRSPDRILKPFPPKLNVSSDAALRQSLLCNSQAFGVLALFKATQKLTITTPVYRCPKA